MKPLEKSTFFQAIGRDKHSIGYMVGLKGILAKQVHYEVYTLYNSI